MVVESLHSNRNQDREGESVLSGGGGGSWQVSHASVPCAQCPLCTVQYSLEAVVYEKEIRCREQEVGGRCGGRGWRSWST